jgi:demethylmenaquinone methyltransferase/2-methoxy-6-polyprenyl-1,4-benzoquinol methylase
VREYYDTRAPEYDEWYRGEGRFAARERPGWNREVQQLESILRSLPAKKTLDVACGTGFLTRHLRGEITVLDQSERMLAITRERIPHATLVQGDALALPFEPNTFERLITGHFYGHLDEAQRHAFLDQARRTAPELVIVDSHTRPDHAGEEQQTRVLNDGSRFQVYKRYFDGPGLLVELGGAGQVLHDGEWFIVVAASALTRDRPLSG